MSKDQSQLVAILENLSSVMDTTFIVLTRYEEDAHAKEIKGANEMIKSWIKDIKEDK